MEYLDEIHPDNPLLPPRSNPELRATVRVLVNIIAADVQPLGNLRVIRRVKSLGGNVEEWCRQFMRKGLAAYEAIIRDHDECGDCYSVGNQMTMADVCLVPAIWSAERYGLDLNEFPEISRVVKALEQHPAIIAAHWCRQLDTPIELQL
ncbi:maleylacetoacetate isomerase [Fusarium mexicanum]|uniref:Maleylacetoacetate isomerase n=1 Tax=Fusarium mexicanum TaxID=751941 RepID=A0A8H5JI64_9HYPO|nr:maleylacetoacetate isomerase [Fusarium mexicanum]